MKGHTSMDFSQFGPLLAWIAGVIAFLGVLLGILGNIVQALQNKHARAITKWFIVGATFPAGALLAASVLYGIDIISSYHPFVCAMNVAACKSAHPLYVGTARLSVSVLMFVSGGFSSYYIKFVIEKYLRW